MFAPSPIGEGYRRYKWSLPADFDDLLGDGSF